MRAVGKNTCNEEDRLNAASSGSHFRAALTVRNSHGNPQKTGVKVGVLRGCVAVEEGGH